MTDRELLKQALEALDNLYLPGELERVNAAITAIRAALAKPEPTVKKSLYVARREALQLADVPLYQRDMNWQSEATTELRRLHDEIDDLRAALAEPEQEPVAWMVYTQDGKAAYVTDNPSDIQQSQRALPLYTHPQPCEYIRSSGTTHWCALAEAGPKDKNQ